MLSTLFLITTLFAADTYSGFAELAAREREGVDYRVVVTERGSAVTVLAIHGGWIEGGTTELAREVAQGGFNLYLFEAIEPDGGRRLHLTSTRFDEPRALELAHRSDFCVSLHGFADERRKVCVGGANAAARDAVAAAIARSFPRLEVVSLCKGLGGIHPKNIVNRCRGNGVQLELSRPLRDDLVREAALRKRFAEAIRGALRISGR